MLLTRSRINLAGKTLAAYEKVAKSLDESGRQFESTYEIGLEVQQKVAEAAGESAGQTVSAISRAQSLTETQRKTREQLSLAAKLADAVLLEARFATILTRPNCCCLKKSYFACLSKLFQKYQNALDLQRQIDENGDCIIIRLDAPSASEILDFSSPNRLPIVAELDEVLQTALENLFHAVQGFCQ